MRFVTLWLSLVAGSSLVSGQTATGTITGTVTDSSGAVISGAKVAVVNTGTSSRLGPVHGAAAAAGLV
jgi:hypothetical protein